MAGCIVVSSNTVTKIHPGAADDNIFAVRTEINPQQGITSLWGKGGIRVVCRDTQWRAWGESYGVMCICIQSDTKGQPLGQAK